MRRSRPAPPARSRTRLGAIAGRSAALALVVLLVGSGCGSDDDDAPAATSAEATTSEEPATTSTTGSTTTEETPTSTTAPSAAARWVGAEWVAAPGGGGPLVDGEPVGLTSVAGLCTDSGCATSLDLLTESPTGAAPAPGPYVLWANRSIDRTDDGRAVWEITDALDVELPEGSTTYVCAPVADPMAQALGLGPQVPPAGDTITPDVVWTVGDGGAIATPDPAGYACEVGMD